MFLAGRDDLQTGVHAMTSVEHDLSHGGTVHAVLRGGPHDLPETLRTHRAPAEDLKIKVLHRGGYEHFERVDGTVPDGPAQVVFEWTMRTKVAE